MLFRKIGCLVGPENWVKQKSIAVLTVKYPSKVGNDFQFLFYLQMNSRLTDRERERERGREQEEKAQVAA